MIASVVPFLAGSTDFEDSSLFSVPGPKRNVMVFDNLTGVFQNLTQDLHN